MTQDNGMDAGPSWEELKEERDEYRDLADQWRYDWAVAMDQRDALAAHVERLVHAACMEGAGPMTRAVIDSAPVDSLARLKAEWQAEAMEGWLEQMRHMEGLNTHDCMESAELYAEGLRQQSEESRDD